jgi:hypothetical protein
MVEERTAYVKALRDFATFLESNPDIPVPGSQNFFHYTTDKELFKAGVKAIGSRGRKEFRDDQWANYIVTIGPLEYCLFIARETVCQRIVVGEKQVEKRIVPAYVEELVEWKCESWLEEKSTDG